MATKTRQPVVAVLGHVDHGKTSLLDAIRQTSLAAREAGGITQSIGASVIETKQKKKITFIDTPGHAAFSKMRSRGVRAADIAILVVAADDGVKPQTLESLKILKRAGVTFIVALTKIDLPTANEQEVLGQLEKQEVFFEGRGGDTVYCPVSAKTKKGIDELLEMITLVAEVSDIKADPGGNFEAVVIETSKDRRGPLVSAIVKNGTLSVGDKIGVEGDHSAKVKTMFDWRLKQVKVAFPGEPVQVLGFSDLPKVGSLLKKLEGVVLQKEYKRQDQARAGDKDKLNCVVKADSQGALEAVLGSLDNCNVISAGIGEVNQNDVFIAKAAGARIFTFGIKTPLVIRSLAESEGVVIENYDIIYDLTDRVKEILDQSKVNVLGRARIVAQFPFNKKMVAGSKVLEGEINKKTDVKLTRGGKDIGKVSIVSIKKGRDDVDAVSQGEECGILFKPQLDFKIGDVLVSTSK